VAKHKKLTSVIKAIVSIGLIYFIFTKIDLQHVGSIVKKAHLGYLFLAILLFTGSKILSAIRVNLYFHQIGIRLKQLANLKLALLGMFYNLFLPGGIGGDAYKGYLLNKEFDVRTKRIVSVLVLDRLSGLLLLFIYACILAMLLTNEFLAPYRWLFGSGIVVSVFIFWLLNKKYFGYVLSIFWKSVFISALVQLFQLLSVLLIFKALEVTAGQLAYLFIFLISSIVTVLPLTIGGIGSREVTFYYGAALFNLNENTSVSISMVFFLISAIVALFGIYYHFKKPRLDRVAQNEVIDRS
jgi:uncharacterized membrane protein YbhN (UPF0104 family)